MKRSPRRLAITAAFALAAGLTPANASHADNLPLVAGETRLGAAWRSFTVTTDGSAYAIDVSSPNIHTPAQVGAAYYSATNDFLSASTLTYFPLKEGVLLRSGDDQDTVETQHATGGGAFARGISFNAPASPPPFVGTRKIVLWWAGGDAAWGTGDAPTWDWSFRAAPGTRIDAMDGGTDALFVMSQDFSSDGQLEAYASNVGGRVSVSADHAFTVRDTLVGIYQAGSNATGSMSVTTPNGEIRQCGFLPVAAPGTTDACTFGAMQGAMRSGPGGYTLHTTSAGAGLSGTADDLWFGGADARLAS